MKWAIAQAAIEIAKAVIMAIKVEENLGNAARLV